MNKLLAIFLLFAVGCQKQIEKPKDVIRPVKTVRVTTGAAVEKASYTGVVKARYETELAFRAAGKILTRKVEAGDRVVTGQLLAEMDPEDYKLSVRAAESALAMAEADMRQAVADETRNRDLAKSKAISPADYDRFKAIADAQVKRVEQAQSQLQLAKNKLEYTTLRADNDGIVTTVNFDAGKVVAEGQPILTLARTEEVEAVVSIPENRVDAAKSAVATVAVWSEAGRVRSAKLRELSPNADPMTRTYTARYTIDKPDRELRFGMTATVWLESRTSSADVVVLPLSAVFDAGQGPRVWVADAKTGRLKAREVAVKEYRQDTVLVSGGLQTGEYVVSAGTHKLDEGLTVRVVEEPSVPSKQ